MMSEPNTVPIPAPEPATPTVAAPAPINFAAESISLVTAVVWKLRTAGSKLTGGVVCVKFCCSGLLWLTKALLIGRMYTRDPDTRAVLAAGAMNRAHANILRWWWFGQFKSWNKICTQNAQPDYQLGYAALLSATQGNSECNYRNKSNKKCVFFMHCCTAQYPTRLQLFVCLLQPVK